MFDLYYDTFGQFIAAGDSYFVIGDVMVHIKNISDYLLQGYGINTYELSDREVIELVEKEYGDHYIRR